MIGNTGSISGRRVLVVEDDYFIAHDLRCGLEERGVVVLGPAPTVGQAQLLLASAEQIDGAMLDINLEGEMIFAVADELLARGVPFVFVTGYDRGFVPTRYAHVTLCEKPLELDTAMLALFSQS